jgi:hypothetical protein
MQLEMLSLRKEVQGLHVLLQEVLTADKKKRYQSAAKDVLFKVLRSALTNKAAMIDHVSVFVNVNQIQDVR